MFIEYTYSVIGIIPDSVRENDINRYDAFHQRRDQVHLRQSQERNEPTEGAFKNIIPIYHFGVKKISYI